VVAVLSGCGRSAPPPQWTTAFWFWQGSSSSVQSAAPVDAIYVHAGTISRMPFLGLGRQWSVHVGLPERLPRAREYWAVFRYDHQDVPALSIAADLAQRFAELQIQSRRQKLQFAGIQLDIDSPTRSLWEYAIFLQAVRKGMPPDTRISITCLLDWFRSGTAIDDVIEQVDEFVPQFYDVAPGYKGNYQSVYWSASGWDLNLVLDVEASIEDLRSFLAKYRGAPDVRLVRYSLAVRLTRENQYEEAAGIYQEIRALPRARRMRQLAELYTGSTRIDATDEQRFEARYKLAEFIAAHPDGIYFNDALWHGIQRYALFASRDSRLTRAERHQLIVWERSLKDDQEERWRAYLMLRSIVHESNDAELRRKAAKLAVRCVRGISTERFGRADEVKSADMEPSSWLRRGGRNRL
jgi:hypothetical protein